MPLDMLLRLNVGGTSFTLKETTIVRRGDANSRLVQLVEATDLGDKNKLCDGYSLEKNEYFFERPAHIFNIIYDYYLTGFLDFPPGVSRKRLQLELAYWGLPSKKNAVALSKRRTLIDYSQSALRARTCLGKTHRFLTKPYFNAFTVFYHSIIVFFILLSIMTLAFRTTSPVFTDYNFERSDNDSLITSNDRQGFVQPIVLLSMDRIDCVLIAIFTAELLIRFVAFPEKRHFFCNAIIVVDMLTILTFVLWILRPIASWYITTNANYLNVFSELLLVSMSVRALKLVRYSSDLRLFGRAVLRCAASIAAIAVLIVVCGTVCSLVIIVLERRNPDSDITDFPSAIWWFLMCMTTIGFGDFRALTIAGKLFTIVPAVFGILGISCVAATVVGSFLKLKKQKI